MAWTPLTKPTTSGWTDTNPPGRTQYDQADILYDDPNVFYDGYDPNSWTDLAKPTTSGWVNVAKPI